MRICQKYPSFSGHVKNLCCAHQSGCAMNQINHINQKADNYPQITNPISYHLTINEPHKTSSSMHINAKPNPPIHVLPKISQHDMVRCFLFYFIFFSDEWGHQLLQSTFSKLRASAHSSQHWKNRWRGHRFAKSLSQVHRFACRLWLLDGWAR